MTVTRAVLVTRFTPSLIMTCIWKCYSSQRATSEVW